MLTYFTAVALAGNGFVAAFVAGTAAGTVGREEVAEERLQLTNDVGTLLSAAVVRLRVAHPGRRRARDLLERPAVRGALPDARPHGAGGAPVRSGLGTRDVLFLGWIGPRGLASILFGLIAIEELHAHGLTAPPTPSRR